MSDRSRQRPSVLNSDVALTDYFLHLLVETPALSVLPEDAVPVMRRLVPVRYQRRAKKTFAADVGKDIRPVLPVAWAVDCDADAAAIAAQPVVALAATALAPVAEELVAEELVAEELVAEELVALKVSAATAVDVTAVDVNAIAVTAVAVDFVAVDAVAGSDTVEVVTELTTTAQPALDNQWALPCDVLVFHHGRWAFAAPMAQFGRIIKLEQPVHRMQGLPRWCAGWHAGSLGLWQVIALSTLLQMDPVTEQGGYLIQLHDSDRALWLPELPPTRRLHADNVRWRAAAVRQGALIQGVMQEPPLPVLLDIPALLEATGMLATGHG